MSEQEDRLKRVADAIREKEGSTATIVADDFADRIRAIQTGTDTSDADATAADILSPKTAYVNGSKVTGTIAAKEAADVTVSGYTVTTPAGYYPSNVTKGVKTVTHPAPAQYLSLGTNAAIIAIHEQAEGYVRAGTTTNSYNVTRESGGTYTPGTSSRTLLSSGLVYLNNPLVMAGSSNLVASNIKNGVNIFGIIGSYSASFPTYAVTISTNSNQLNIEYTNSSGYRASEVIGTGYERTSITIYPIANSFGVVNSRSKSIQSFGSVFNSNDYISGTYVVSYLGQWVSSGNISIV